MSTVARPMSQPIWWKSFVMIYGSGLVVGVLMVIFRNTLIEAAALVPYLVLILMWASNGVPSPFNVGKAARIWCWIIFVVNLFYLVAIIVRLPPSADANELTTTTVNATTDASREETNAHRVANPQEIVDLANKGNQYPKIVTNQTGHRVQIYALTYSNEENTIDYTLRYLDSTKDQMISESGWNPAAFVHNMLPIVAKDRCDDPSVRRAIDSGVALRYRYISSDSQPLATVNVDKSVCENLQ